MDRLNTLGRVLYVAAHPDDENTAVLAYLANERMVQTAYLSLTRGSGGQNLLGKEKGSSLGILRTQELLAARRIDKAEQFFTRAIDFGYSKSMEETLQNWDREQVLEDMVYVIREFRPDVIITRFSSTRGGHGHHLASAVLAEEAFHAAADPGRFSSQLQTMSTWQAKRIVWDSWMPDENAISLEIGSYNPLLGTSCQQIAAASRSMHKSQGFGAAASHGSRQASFIPIAGDTAKTDLFDGIDLSWNRLSNGKDIGTAARDLTRRFKPESPWESIPALIDIYRLLEEAEPSHFASSKIAEVRQLMQMCSGLWLEAFVREPGADRDQVIDIHTLAVNRSPVPIIWKKLHIHYADRDTLINHELGENKPLSLKKAVTIPVDAPYSQPFWLRHEDTGTMYVIPDQSLSGKPESPPALTATYTMQIAGKTIDFTVPVQFRETDPVRGAVYEPFHITPQLSLSVDHPGYVFPDTTSRLIHVQLENLGPESDGDLVPVLPEGWKISPRSHRFRLAEGVSREYTFKVTPLNDAANGSLTFEARTPDRTYNHELIRIAYAHIAPQSVMQPARTRLIPLDISIESRSIGYIMGSGDDIPQALEQLGYPVTLLTDEEIENGDLTRYDVIICGVRAFNTRETLNRQQARLNAFVRDGGTWIVQHNTRFGNRVDQIGPYSFTASGKDRISEETAPIRILLPEHPLMSAPNQITETDFENWVQERGLYFAEKWEGKLYPLLSGHDQGESSKLGGLLYATYGEGVFIYTAFSWFRQLPAGVPGAYRIFVNLISAKGGL